MVWIYACDPSLGWAGPRTQATGGTGLCKIAVAVRVERRQDRKTAMLFVCQVASSLEDLGLGESKVYLCFLEWKGPEGADELHWRLG